eukprot:jgi/Tetstr1/432806/TSEL_022158.t1
MPAPHTTDPATAPSSFIALVDEACARMVESPPAVAAGDVARDAVENAFWDDNDDVGEGETDADDAIADASPALISPEVESACEDGIGDGEGAAAPTVKANSKWALGEVLVSVRCVLAANRSKSTQTVLKRAKLARSFYNKFASDVVALGIWTPGKDGHPTIEESYERRTSFTESGKNKGKSPLFTKHAEIVKIVQNEILPILRRHLGPDEKPPSGKTWADVQSAAKLEYWEHFSLSRARVQGKPIPTAWTEPAWECFVLFGQLPNGKNIGEFCLGGTPPTGAGPATGRATQRELENNRKRTRREGERTEAAYNLVAQHFGEQKKASNSTASALSKNNKIWTAQLLLKHGNEQQRDKAMQILMKNLEEEDEAPTAPQQANPAPVDYSSPAPSDYNPATVGQMLQDKAAAGPPTLFLE